MFRDIKRYFEEHGMKVILGKLHSKKSKDRELVEQLADFRQIFGLEEFSSPSKK